MQGWYNIHKSINIIHYINKRKDQNHMIISIDAENAFDKVQHLFKIKTLRKVGIEGAYLNIVKAICEKPTASIILNGEKLKSFPTKIRNKTRMSTFTTSIQNSIGSPSHSDQTIKRNKRHPFGKKKVKLMSLFAHDMIVYIEHPMDSTKKLHNLISELGKTVGYKVNI